ncbi:hypothetical protein [Brevundimonas sp.]|uniref:hypothetical protein n=1 Tax=Brevundimonas sp. TaxID=1871086 RepID=UPI003568F131
MKRTRLKVCAVVALALTPAACSAYQHIRVIGGLEQPSVIMSESANSERPVRACVDYLTVFEPGRGKGLDSAVWRVRSADDRCVVLKSITYGQTPEGFVVDTPAQPLSADTVYEISGHGWTGGWMPRVPWIGGDRVRYSDGAWRSVAY